MRNLGGSIGIAIISTVMTEQSQVGWNPSGGNISYFNEVLLGYWQMSVVRPDASTWAIVGETLGQQAAVRGIFNAFTLVLIGFIAMISLVLLMPRRNKESPSALDSDQCHADNRN